MQVGHLGQGWWLATCLLQHKKAISLQCLEYGAGQDDQSLCCGWRRAA